MVRGEYAKKRIPHAESQEGRAQYLIQHFIKTLKHVAEAPRAFKPILVVESYLHLVNPWLLPITTAILLHQTLKGSITAVALIALGLALLVYKPFRTWITTQLYLIVATIRNLWTKEIVWRKQAK